MKNDPRDKKKGNIASVLVVVVVVVQGEVQQVFKKKR